MDLSGRNHESPTRRLRLPQNGGLGDMTPGWGAHVPGQTDAMAAHQSQYGYRPTPNRRSITEKFQTELAAGVPDLRRQQSANEATNYTFQAHPIQDAPYFADGIYFSTPDTVVAAGGTSNFTVVTASTHNMAFLRHAKASLISAGAQDFLRLTVRINGAPFGNGLFQAPMAAFSDIPCPQNIYVRIMPRQVCTVEVLNEDAVPHTFRLSLIGWQYLASEFKETSRGAIPAKGV